MAGAGGSIVTLSYLGAERVVPNYNVMGVAKASLEATVRYLAYDLGKETIRVNAVSAGPIKTLAAAAISNFEDMIKHVAARAPLGRGVDADEVGDAVMFLLSSLSRGITGEVIYVDAGYSVMGTL
jgi:enoyl-[acyl-carrier protein] reductase I